MKSAPISRPSQPCRKVGVARVIYEYFLVRDTREQRQLLCYRVSRAAAFFSSVNVTASVSGRKNKNSGRSCVSRISLIGLKREPGINFICRATVRLKVAATAAHSSRLNGHQDAWPRELLISRRPANNSHTHTHTHTHPPF